MIGPADESAEAPGEAPRSAFRLWAAVIILTLVYCFAFVDRNIFNLLVQPIRRDYGVSDVEIGYLLGPAFIFSYAGLGLPAGWCADRFNRRNMLLAAGVMWGMGTMAAAFATSYSGLFVSRLIVGGSEAFLFPAGISLLADIADRRRLPVATSIFLLAPLIGTGVALMAGGALLDMTDRWEFVQLPLLGQIRGWQFTLFLVGLAGILPVVMLIFVRDPRRGARKGAGEEQRFGFFQGTAYMAKRWRFYIMFFIGNACSSLVMLTVAAWGPTHLIRTFDLTPGEVGARYGTLVLIFGLLGGISSPIVNAWFARRGEDSPMRTVRLGPYIMVASALTLWLVQSQLLVLAALTMVSFAHALMSMSSTSLQLAAPPRLRGVASAYYFVIVSLLGYGVGPTLVPLVSEHLLNDGERIGEALSYIALFFGTLSVLAITAALHGFRIERGLRAGPGQ